MTRSNFLRQGSGALALAALSLAIRLPGLGSWCLTFDEFYILSSVRFIQSGFLPEFPGGGFYTRGLLLQYLTAAVGALFEDPEFTVRILPLLAGVAAIPVFYLLARRVLSEPLTFAATLAMVLSSWQIEFSRFGRMYSVYQLLFLLLAYCLVRGFVDGSARHRRILWICAFLSPLLHEASIFLPPLLLAVLLLKERSDAVDARKHLVLTGLLTVVVLAVNLVDYRNLGIEDRLPAGFASSGSSLPLSLPGLDLMGRIVELPVAAGFLAALVLAGLILSFVPGRGGPLERLLRVAIVLALGFHQIGLALWLVVLAVLLHPRFRDGLVRASALWKASVLSLLLFWSVAGFTNASLWLDGRPVRSVLRGLADTFFFYPNVYDRFALPFLHVVPVFFLVILAAAAVATVRALVRRPGPGRALLLQLVLSCIFLLSVIDTLYHETRYSYFFFPILMLVGWLQVSDLCGLACRALRRMPRTAVEVACGVVVLGFFVLAEDFHLRHVTHVSDADINFRLGRFEPFQRHWYPRMDVEGPSRFVNDSFRDGDRAFIDLIPCSMYLEVPYAVYHDEGAGSFAGISRQGGTRELWTGRELVRRAADLAALVPGEGRSRLWLITMAGDRGPHSLKRENAPASLAGRHDLTANLEFTGVDGRVQVWSMRPAGGEGPAGPPPIKESGQ